MKFIRQNMYILLYIFLVILCLTTDAFAAGDIFAEVRKKVAHALNDLKGVVYIIGGLGLIAFSFAAVFGKISFKHLATISLSLLLVSSMGMFIHYFSGGDKVLSEIEYGDFLKAFPPG